MARVFIATLILIGVGFGAIAQTTTWTGTAGDGLWTTVGNWNNGVPVNNYDVINYIIYTAAGL